MGGWRRTLAVLVGATVAIGGVVAALHSPASRAQTETRTKAASRPPEPSRPVAAAGDGRAAPVSPPQRVRVALWGDSLAWESASSFEWALGASPEEVTVESHTFGGTAPCDWRGEILASERAPVDVALLAFSGNAFTPCMQDRDGTPVAGAELVAKYRADVEELVMHLRRIGAEVLLVGPPVLRPDIDPGRVERLRKLYQELAAANAGVYFADAGAAVLHDGRFAMQLPCASWEGTDVGCSGGSITVRSADGVHFCPAVVGGGACPMYSSGAARYGMSMATAVTEHLDAGR